MDAPILITGCARSGTSMVAGCVNLCGAFGGNMSGPNKNNAKGMFENHVIREQIVKPYLQSVGADKMGQFPLPDIENLKIPLNWKSRVESVIQSQGYEDGSWMYKGAKMVLVWPLWHYAFPNAKWIIVRRRTGDIINSCLKTSFMRAFTNLKNQKKVGVETERDGWLWWVRWHEQRFVEMIQEGLNVKVVWPERMVTGDYQQLYEAIEWAGLDWSSEIYNFIDPKLWKARRKR
jgi:hypothetical protein